MNTPNTDYVPYVTHVRTPEGDGLVTQLPTPNTVIVKLGVYPFAVRYKAFWRSDVTQIDDWWPTTRDALDAWRAVRDGDAR